MCRLLYTKNQFNSLYHANYTSQYDIKWMILTTAIEISGFTAPMAIKLQLFALNAHSETSRKK